MAFTRDDMKTYEAQTPTEVADDLETVFAAPAAAPAEPAASAPASAPAATPEPAAESPAAAAPDPAAPGGESSAEKPAESAAADAAPDGDTETDSATPAPKGSAQERIANLVAERNALRKYGEFQGEKVAQLTAEIAALRKGTAAPTGEPSAPDQSTAAPAPAADPRPTLEQFNFDTDAHEAAENAWLQRQIDRSVEMRLNKEKAATAQQTEQQKAQDLRAAFEQRAAKFAEKTPDFTVVVSNPALTTELQAAPAATRALAQSEQSAQILYHLAKHMDLTARITRMGPEQQILAIGRLEAQLEQQSATPQNRTTTQKTLTQAPPPPTPNAGSTTPTKDIGSMSMSEFVAHERAEELRKREQRKALRGTRR